MLEIKEHKNRDEKVIKEILYILKDADEDLTKIKNTLLNNDNTIYNIYLNKIHKIGAIDEILYISIIKNFRSKGYGKKVITLIIEKAQKMDKKYIIVGTGNSSLDNISFYQKCGFRFDSIIKDYFSYIVPPIKEFNIELKNMIMFKYNMKNR
jgi:ribosomal protein S18 acetylase RimI-like enzyme